MEMKRFIGQVAVITGAASGIGQACAYRFAEEGAVIVCLDIQDEANQATASHCRSFGVETLAYHLDVTDPENVKNVIGSVEKKLGRIDILVASAGIYSGSPIQEVLFAEWKRLIDINLTGVFLCNQAVAPIMMKQKAGSIINVSSMAGKTSFPASAEYSASKSGVIGLSRSIALDLAPFGITVNAVCPGNTKTQMVRNVAAMIGQRDGMTADEWLEMRAKDCPMGRLAEPWEQAGVIAFLASKDARYITGQSIEVDGGMVLS